MSEFAASGDNGLEDDLRWRTAKGSAGNGACVDVAAKAREFVAVRDSMDRDGPQVHYSPEAWAAFTGAVKAGLAGEIQF